jgi:autophagy-related protein 9
LKFIFRFISFAAGAILAVLILLTVYDEDVLNVEHMLTTITSLGVVVGICRSLIPDEVRKKNKIFNSKFYLI